MALRIPVIFFRSISLLIPLSVGGYCLAEVEVGGVGVGRERASALVMRPLLPDPFGMAPAIAFSAIIFLAAGEGCPVA